ncbi:MAG: glycosyltransferase family 1 protein [Firmicutes bacterium]|nr:glycosyltransferase family 1 protein [Bacillota bacterium]
MKIAFFTDTFLPQINGVTKTLARLIKYLDKKGIEHLVFAPDHHEEDFFTYNVERFLSFKFFLYPECRLSIPNFFRIHKKLNAFRPELIHIATEFNMGLAGLQYGKTKEVPIVSSYHTNFSKYLQYYGLEFLENALWNYMQWFHNQCSINLCPSHETKKMLENKGVNHLGIWTRGIDCEEFKPEFRSQALRESLGAADKIVLLYVGRISIEKDLDILFDSFKNINQKYYDKVSLVITGDGPMLSKFKTEAPDNVIFTGYKQGRELAEIYASADIFMFPSTTETFGNVVMESMASGVPVVSVAVGGIKDNLLDGHNGLICKPRNVQDFTQAAMRLIEDRVLRVELGYQARQYALMRSWKNVFDKLISDYERTLAYHNKKYNISA